MINSKDIRSFRQNGCLSFPKIVQIEITNRCPFRCLQCYKSKLAAENMPLERVIELIEECKNQGTELFILNGGEPLMHPQINSIVKYLTEQRVQFNCFSSGYGLTEEIIDYIKIGYMQFYVSLNGSTENVNRNSREGYNYAINAIKMLKERNAPFLVNWVARHDNVYDFPDLVQLAMNYQAKAVSIIGNKLVNNQFIDSPLELEDYRFLAEYINFFPYYNRIGIVVEQCFPVLSTLLTSIPRVALNGCLAGIYSCNVTLDGYYMPCTQLQYREKYNSVKEYWENSKILEKLRKIKKEEMKYCDKCHVKYCKTCRAIDKECHDDFTVGYRLCPIRENSM